MPDIEDNLIAIPRVNPNTFNTFVNQYFTTQGLDATSRQLVLDFLYEIAVDATIRDIFMKFLRPAITDIVNARGLSQLQYVHDISNVVNNRVFAAGNIPDASDLLIDENEETPDGNYKPYFAEPVLMVAIFSADIDAVQLTINYTEIGAQPAHTDIDVLFIPTTKFDQILIPAFEQLNLVVGG